MYRSCIFCSAPLGSNDSIERFPVGRSLAFDGEKGRLWAVCGRCARWNLAPIEERWEAIEDAERLFRDTRTRVQSENIGLAKLPDGTRLVRVGGALPGELAAWRYGETLVRRRRRHAIVGGTVAMVGAVGAVAGVAGAGFSLVGGVFIHRMVRRFWEQHTDWRVVQRLRPTDSAEPVTLRRRDFKGARLVHTAAEEIGIRFLNHEERRYPALWAVDSPFANRPLVITGDPARTLLARAMVHVNLQGARPAGVAEALRRITRVGSPEDFLRTAARNRLMLLPLGHQDGGSFGTLALEMALHEETERRALEGELAMLEGMWREAEEIAAIADRLPELPAPEPPRLATGG